MNNQSTKTNINRQQTVSRKKVLVKGIAIGIIIIAVPFCFDLYKLAPETEVWKTRFGVIYAEHYGYVQYFFHALFTKLFLLFAVSYCFFVTKSFYKWAFLPWVVQILYQIRSVVNDSTKEFDDFEFVDSLPFVIPIVVIYIIIALKAKNRVLLLDLKDQVEVELQDIEKQIEKENI